MNWTLWEVARLESWDGPGLVAVGFHHQADCDCVVLEGMRMDTKEPVIGCWSCSAEHKALLDGFNERLWKDIPEPSRSLHEVVVERLAELEEPSVV